MLSLSRSLSCLSYFGCQIDLSPSLSFLSLYFHCVLTLHPLCRMLSLPFFLAPKCSSIQLSPVFLISLFPLSVFCPSLVHHISTTLPLLSFTALSLARYFSHSINQTHSHLSHDMIPPTPPPLSLLVSRGQRLDSGHLIVPLVSLVQRGPHENKAKQFRLFFFFFFYIYGMWPYYICINKSWWQIQQLHALEQFVLLQWPTTTLNKWRGMTVIQSVFFVFWLALCMLCLPP